MSDTWRHAGGWLGRWAPVLAVGGGMIAAGPPDGLSANGWWFAAVFSATIVGFLSRPLPMGPMVLVGLVTLLLAGAYGHGSQAVEGMLSGYSDATVWLVSAAFLLSGTVVRTGFGRRIALLLIRSLGRTTLGLGYAISGSELILGPIIPSNTARGGAVMAPIVNALTLALGASPYAERRPTGGYLMLCGAHANLIAAAMFFTGMAANPQLGVMARDVFDLRWDWASWFRGSWPMGLISFGLLPLVLYKLHPPDLTHSPAAREEAINELREMGPWNGRQITVGLLLLAMVVAWALEPWHGVYSAGIALTGIAAILILKLDRWQDMTGDRAAWDALMWLGGLVGVAKYLKSEGVIAWFADLMKEQVVGLHGVVAAVALALIYFFSMYAFSMLTGHIVAMGAAFFVVAQAAGSPPLLVVALISYFSNLCGCLTNYSTGPVVIYSGFDFVTTRRWFAVGFGVALFHLVVWLGVGLPYWKLLGWW
ncbi:MAG: DASS family sodium-coupled anion symporter [Planctomycetaceae bacterium]|nr:DASS family sodium-coupled anion symporter [Planctomycetaceae bacterium]